ncbi:hypothetical protein FA15DRAFT_579097, partial [Coprinopsis marcescibilis]
YSIIGPTGSGKSSFINAVTEAETAPVGHELSPVSATDSITQHDHTLAGRARVRLIDTPGFNNNGGHSSLSPSFQVSNFILRRYDGNRVLTGIIYLRQINDQNRSGMRRTAMRLTRELYGFDTMENMIIVTIFWDQLSTLKDGTAAEELLRSGEGLLKIFQDGGGKTLR